MGQADERGKEPVSALLAGPYGHPFHPMLVTIPIGAWASSLVFDAASHLTEPASTFATGARWLIGIGVLGALVAATVGFLDFVTIPAGTRAHRTAVMHMVLNLLVTTGFAADFAWRLGDGGAATRVGPFALSLVCFAALGVSGTLGGKLAYHYGIRVVAETVQAQGFSSASGTTPGADRSSPRIPEGG